MAMDSVLGQSYPNLELLVMDDGSTDGTPELLEEYSRNHPPERFRFSRHENMGQARTLNRGYEMFVVEDCCAGVPQEWHDWSIRNTLPLMATITTADEVEAALRG